MKKYVCSICGKEIDNLDDYVTHVQKCANNEKEKKDKEYQELVSLAAKKVNTARDYYKECLENFKQKYPNEVEKYFSGENTTKTPKIEFIELSGDSFLDLLNSLLL